MAPDDDAPPVRPASVDGSFLQSSIDEHHDFLSWLGTDVDALEKGRIVMSLPYDEKLINARLDGSEDRPELNDGAAATLIDTAGGLTLRTTLDDPLASSCECSRIRRKM